MKIHLFFAIAFAPFVWQCGGTDSEPSKSSESKNNSVSKDMSCLTEYQQAYCDLVSKNTIASILEVNAEKIEQEEKFYPGNNPKMISCHYEWPTDRMKTISFMNQTREVPDENFISFGQMDVIEEKDLERYNKKSVEHYFEEFHKTASKEDEETMKESYDEEIDDTEMQEKDAAKKIGKSIISSISKIKYVQVKNLGDNAYYSNSPMSGTQEVHLDVLLSNVTFKVSVNASPEQDKNVDIAVAVAKEILKACK